MDTDRASILIVDDSALNREMLRNILSDRYSIDEAADGAEAISILEKRAMDYSLVLLDIIMPGADGFDVLAHLNSRGWIGYLPVIMMSSADDRGTVRRAYRLGAADFINRPYDPDTVRQRVVNIIALYDRQRQMERLVQTKTRENRHKSELMTSILSHIVEFRNGESGPHVINIKTITGLMLRELANIGVLPEGGVKDIPVICDASALHDIGKIVIPNTILNKAGRLSDEEYEIIKTHSTVGADMIKDMPVEKDEPLIRYAYDICRWHHERIDGTGYPDSLCGSTIPLHARVVSIADVYDALTADRCYRPAFSHEEAMEMIKTGKCGAFDPILVRCLENVAPQLLKLKENKLYGDTAFELGDLNLTSDITIPNEMSAAARHAEANRDQLRFLIENTNGYCICYQDAPPLLTLSARAARRIGCPESVEDPLSSNKLSPFVRTVLLPQVINATKQRDSAEQEFTMEIIDPKSERPVNLKCRTLAVDKGQKYHGFIAIAERITDHK